MLYRKDLLDAGGVKEFPKTWEEMFEVAKKLQNPPNLYGVGFQFNKAGTDAESTFRMMGYDYGAAYVKEDGKTLTVKSPEMLQTLQLIKKSWDMGIYPPGVTGWSSAIQPRNEKSCGGTPAARSSSVTCIPTSAPAE